MNGVIEPDEGTPRVDYIFALPRRQIVKLLQIKKPEDIKSISDIITWEDDHTLCVGAMINGIEVSWWWYGPSLVGHLMYSNIVPQAKKEVFDYLRELIKRTAENEEGFAKIVDQVEQDEQTIKNIGPEAAKDFDEIIRNILH